MNSLIYITDPKFIEVKIINSNLTNCSYNLTNYSYNWNPRGRYMIEISLDITQNLEFITFIQDTQFKSTSQVAGYKFIMTIGRFILNGCFVKSIEHSSNNITDMEISIDHIIHTTDDTYSQILAQKRDETINRILDTLI